ncbi:MAG: hypothetical protein J6S61_04910, partial [Elusimicrobiaceae bacterium]|nr:hypothetical protein [Elusimicrobiaceae bacterium]
TYDGPRLFGNKYLYVDFYYVVYNEEGKEAFSKVKSYELSISGHMLGGEELGDFGKFKIHYITLLNELANTVFDNEEAAQNLLNKHKAKKEKKEKKAIEKEKKEKKKQKRKKAINETWENLFH